MSHTHEKYQELIKRAQAVQPVATAIVHPCDESSLSGAIDAAKLGLIRPTLVGPKAKIQAVAEKLKLDIAGFEIVEAKLTGEKPDFVEDVKLEVSADKTRVTLSGTLLKDKGAPSSWFAPVALTVEKRIGPAPKTVDPVALDLKLPGTTIVPIPP